MCVFAHNVPRDEMSNTSDKHCIYPKKYHMIIIGNEVITRYSWVCGSSTCQIAWLLVVFLFIGLICRRRHGVYPFSARCPPTGEMEEGGRFSSGHLVTHIKSACISLPAILYTSLRVSICHFETSVTWKVIILKCKFWPDFFKDSFYLHIQSGYWYSSDLMKCESTWMSAPIQTLVFTQTTWKLAPVRIATAWHIMHALFCFLRPLAETNRGRASKHLKAGKGLLHACTCSFNIKINIATHCGAWKNSNKTMKS